MLKLSVLPAAPGHGYPSFLLYMRNHAVVTIEGRKGSVKGKGKLHAVELNIAKLQF
jgi:hypothetical protein